MSNHQHVVDTSRTDTKITVTVVPLGDERKELESAAQYAYNRSTSHVRACLVAMGYAETNASHAHSGTYEMMADEISITRETFEKNGLDYIRFTFEEN